MGERQNTKLSTMKTHDNADTAQTNGEKSSLKRIFPLLKPYKTALIGAVIALVVAAGTVLAIGACLRFLVDYGLSRENDRILDLSLVGLIIIIILLSIASFFRSYLVATIGEKLIADMRKKVYANLIHLDPGFYESTNTGELISRVTADTTVLQSVLASTLPVAIRNAILLVGGLIALFIASPKLSLIFIIVVPVIVIPIIIFARKVRTLSKYSQEEISKLGAHMDETLHGIQVVQSFAQERKADISFKGLTDKALGAATKHIKMRAAMGALVIFLSFNSIGIVLWIGGHDVISGEMSPGALTSFVFYAVLTASATGTLSEVYGGLNRAAGAAERLFDLIDKTPELANADGALLNSSGIDGHLHIDDVSFAYKAFPDKSALKKISLDIKAGETIAIVGPSGSGKTTLFKLLLRFYDPDAGHIKLDDQDIRSFNLESYRRSFGIVPQDPVLFSDTIRRNIAYGDDSLNIEDLQHLADNANALDFINNLPGGFDTPIGERGTRLSGGQRQRIAIARALAHDPKILLFDEATSSLDSNSERAIQSALQRIKKRRTLLIIAHRLSTVLIADRIVLLKDGEIETIGTHDQLLKASALYKEMVNNQMIDKKEV